MAPEWRSYCAISEYAINGDTVNVRLTAGRSHRVRVVSDDTSWQFQAMVSRRGVALSILELRLLVWQRNRNVDLVGFRVDARGRVIGEAWVPVAGTTAAEFRFALDTVARECDLLEYALTGSDAE
jgi:hypothetical protein